MTLLSYISEWMIPALIFVIVITGLIKKKGVYEDFIKGAKDGFITVAKIAPTMAALMIAVGVLRASGFLDFLAGMLTPLAALLHFPRELVPLTLVKMVSTSASTGLLLDIFKTYGPDSYIGNITSIMLSSTETIFYTMSIYYMAAGIRKTRYTLAGCLVATLVGIIASVILAGLM